VFRFGELKHQMTDEAQVVLAIEGGTEEMHMAAIDETIRLAMDQNFVDGQAAVRSAGNEAIRGHQAFSEVLRLESLQSRQLTGAKAATALLTDDAIGRSILTQRAVSDQPGKPAGT
jgi:hypothetical protein